MKRIFVLAVAFDLSLSGLAAAETTRLPGHRAVYELELGDTRGGGAIVGAEGRYVFDLEDLCDGYTLNERLVVQLARASDTILTDYRLSAYETEEGDLYRFSTETEFNGQAGQSAEGNLSVAAESAEVDYKTADDVTFDEAVLPPLAHIRAILEAARAGKDRYAATVFDGDVEKPVFYAVTRIAEQDGEDSLSKVKGAEAIGDMSSWRIDSVYFPPSNGDAAATEVPEFRFTGTLYENGVVTDLVLDYVDFSLEASLVELEVHDSGC